MRVLFNLMFIFLSFKRLYVYSSRSQHFNVSTSFRLIVCGHVDDGEGLEDFVIDDAGKGFAVQDLGGVGEGFAVHLPASVLHVDEADVFALEELGVTAAVAVDGNGFFKEVLTFFVEREGAAVASARADALFVEHDGLQIDAFANFHCLWFHNLVDLIYTLQRTGDCGPWQGLTQ